MPQIARWTLSTLMLCLLAVCGCGGTPTPEPTAATPKAKVAPAKKAEDGSAQKPVELPPVAQSNVEPSAATVAVAEPMSDPKPEAKPEYFRFPHPKRRLDLDDLKARGIIVTESESKIFRLVSDLPVETRRPLEPLVDQVLPSLQSYFGPLPPARDRSAYHVTGFVFKDRALFEDAGLLPEEVTVAFHGKQMGAEFWMNNQVADYYRSHLLLHEATHVYMRQFPENGDGLPAWYLEGMAEFFATHERQADGSLNFAVNPRDRYALPGWERIAVVQRDVAVRGVRSINEVLKLEHKDYARVESYAWSWALCRFLDSHPASREAFRELAKRMTQEPVADVNERVQEITTPELEANWMQYAAGIEFAYDFDRSSIQFGEGAPLTGEARTVEVDAARGLQSSGITVQAGAKYSITAAGQFTLAEQPKPWVSEANGVTIRYVRGEPIGRLLACVRTKGNEQAARSMLVVTPLGNAVEFSPEYSGTLYLRVNDSPAELSDNKGTLSVSVELK